MKKARFILSLFALFLIAIASCANPSLVVEEADLDPDVEGRAYAWPVLKNGSSGSQVKALQYLLIYRGRSVTVDGAFGPATESAVKSFQSANGLVADGIVGSATWPKLIATVQYGSNNYAVRGAQVLLKERFGYSLTVDGAFGSGTQSAVKAFQSSKGISADGIVGPTTWLYLAGSNSSSSTDFWGSRAGNWVFPVKVGILDPAGSARYFGASRDGGTRAHAGVDLIPTTGPGATVYAMTSGTVLAYYAFYMGTYALEVKSDDGTVVRYGEISSGLRAGARVSKGQAIGSIIRNTSSAASYMLHLEVYMGTSTGSLSQTNSYYKYVPSRNYVRRSDLIDPMGVIKLR